MQRRAWLAALGLMLMALSARAEITGGVMAVKGCEMS